VSVALRPDTTAAARRRGRGGAPAAGESGPRLSRLDLRLSPYLYVAPFFVVFGIFGLYPLVYTLWVSLHDWELLGSRTFVGIDNYTKLFADDLFWNAVLNTTGIFVLSTVPQLLVALGFASLLNRGLTGRLVFRLGIILPIVTSVAAVAIVFNQLYSRDFGLVNWVLGGLGVDRIEWQAHRWSSWVAIASMVNWRWTGYNALIYLAAMQAIPRDLYESAALDGASAWRQFRSITVPLLRPTIIFTVIISTIGGFQLFTEPLLFNPGANGISGGSLRQFQTVTMYVYENAFGRFDYGYAAAAAWLLFMLILVASLVNFLIVRRMNSTK
jgi:cellobiose transport system permease protein